MRDYPKVELEISEMITSEIVEALKRDRIDAALVASGTCGEGILEQELFSDRFYAYVSPEIRFMSGRTYASRRST